MIYHARLIEAFANVNARMMCMVHSMFVLVSIHHQQEGQVRTFGAIFQILLERVFDIRLLIIS